MENSRVWGCLFCFLVVCQYGSTPAFSKLQFGQGTELPVKNNYVLIDERERERGIVDIHTQCNGKNTGHIHFLHLKLKAVENSNMFTL